MTFQIDSGDREGAAVLVATGELDLATVEILEAAVERAIEEDHSRVVIDLTGVKFMDSTGMRALLVATQRLEAIDRSLGVVLNGGPVARALAITGVDRLLKLFDTLEAATA
ncbi:MAG: STAS domain-containing protein [Acidimicrobiia bacterium]|nr:STAS domain-containing protein [Acidimicrobiia bacterium]